MSSPSIESTASHATSSFDAAWPFRSPAVLRTPVCPPPGPNQVRFVTFCQRSPENFDGRSVGASRGPERPPRPPKLRSAQTAADSNRRDHDRSSDLLIAFEYTPCREGSCGQLNREIVCYNRAKMGAVQVSQAKGPFELVERDIPDPGPGCARVRVEACGICHSDSLTKEGAWPASSTPGSRVTKSWV